MVVTKKLKKSPKKMATRSMRVQNSVSVLNLDNIRDIEAIQKVRNNKELRSLRSRT